MTRFTQIDLENLPAPQVVETLDVEAIFARKRDALLALAPDLAPVLALESEPLTMYLQRDAFDEVLLRAAVNDGARAVMPAYATGANLDQLAAFYGVARLVLAPAQPDATPPVAAVMESDSDFRSRMQLALEAQTTAGTVGSYLFFARSADPRVRDIAVANLAPGVVGIRVLAEAGDGSAPADLLQAVETALNDDFVRPLTDLVQVESAVIVPYQVAATLTFYDGPDSAVVLETSRAAVTAYVAARRLIGENVTRSGLFAALHGAGVQNVVLASPAADIEIDGTRAAFCTDITLTAGGIDA
ncbi:baseplate assembly protein [Loktanella sp. 3ANDIMAR09]|uniref:baseplate assembly protein n=1 Tax=Loktanella sp. 3ANDIMAR09 TaxID=1225657 RepID=UPI0006F56AD1|nr:baseplate J/gp47 family protein [Loktanella sp. 3ANDIMAR09]KQI67006.1 baseplate assembly protein [Loktanella sp. 3ANDIMAR09]